MKLTDATKADRHFRAYRRCLTLAQTIDRQLQYYNKHHSSQLSPGHQAKAERAIASLNELRQIIVRLDRYELKSHTQARDLIERPTKDTLAEIFTGLPARRPAQRTGIEQAVVDLMNQTGKNTRQQAHRATLGYEIAHRASLGWFMVFNTLTVNSNHYHKVFNPDSTAFKDYLRHVDRQSAQSSYGSIRAAIGREHHTYFAVVEEGAQNGRLHIHVVHFLKNLPKGSADPNRGLAVPTRRELSTLKAKWPFGFSSPIMVRYSPQDAYGLAGFRWPYDTKTEKPYAIGSPLRLSSYMSKYIMKSYNSSKRSSQLWRIRKTQSLGQQVLQELLSTLTDPQLLEVARCPSQNLKLNNQRIPHQLLRHQALRLYSTRPSRPGKPTILAIARDLQPALSPLQCLRGSTRTSPGSSPQNSTPTPTSTTAAEAISDATWSALRGSARAINSRYFRFSTQPPGTTSTRDHLWPTDPHSSQARPSPGHLPGRAQPAQRQEQTRHPGSPGSTRDHSLGDARRHTQPPLTQPTEA